ncbi:hypothetical protein AB0C96_32800 [Streptomyces sp. NPDC048506]|uniref:hypothetical protein n=1 Tax=Streptomyces sp. NPDC048506 TaxID=3155028 RepID=UPI0034334C24
MVLVTEAGQVAGRFLHPGWSSAWAHALPEVLALLADPVPEVRRAAADLTRVCASSGTLLLAPLLHRWQVESDMATRLDLVLALGRAVRREPAGDRSQETTLLLHGLLDSPEPQLRLAAVHALADGDAGRAQRRLELVLDAVRDPSVELWQHTSAVECGVQGVQHWTAALFTGASAVGFADESTGTDTFTDTGTDTFTGARSEESAGACTDEFASASAGASTSFTLGLLADHPDPEQRIGALAQAGGLLSQWRSPATALLPAIAARLNDPAAEVRYRAAELLACLGPSAAAHGDAVAELLDDTVARTTRTPETVADAALWALARMNDPRCVPGLAARVAGAPSGFPSTGVFHSARHAVHFPLLPALHEVLARLPDHAELLLPAIRDRLGTATDPRLLDQLCDVLAAWGPAAEAAVPQLLDLLEDDHTWPPAATALAAIGTAGNGAGELLLARSTAGGAGADAELAAWAYWRIGGEPAPALNVLGPAVAKSRHLHPALRRLADLGPHAAGYVDEIRTATTDTDPWTRVEAAHALWAATGDTDTTIPVLVDAVQELAHGTYAPVMLPAVRHLSRMGRAARPAARLLHKLPIRDRRLHHFGAWRTFTEDESVRAAVDELLTAAG